MTSYARHLHEGGHLRADISVGEAPDGLWTYNSAEVYELLVLARGWDAPPVRPLDGRRNDRRLAP